MENMKLWRITHALITILLINGAHTTARPHLIASESPPPAAYNCNELIYDMVDCLNFLSNGESDSKPSPACCTGFQEVLNDDADCVCEGLQNAGSMGLSINMTKAASLPTLCTVSAPPISSCNVSTAPVPSPGQSPANPPATNPPTTNPPADSPPSNPPSTPPDTATPPTSSGSPKAGSPAAASIAPSSHHKSSGTSTVPSTMSMFLIFSIVAVSSFLV